LRTEGGYRLTKRQITTILTSADEHDDYETFKTKERTSIESKLLFYGETREAFGAGGAFRFINIFADRFQGKVSPFEIVLRIVANMDTRFEQVYPDELRERIKERYSYARKYVEKHGQGMIEEIFGKQPKINPAVEVLQELEDKCF